MLVSYAMGLAYGNLYDIVLIAICSKIILSDLFTIDLKTNSNRSLLASLTQPLIAMSYCE